MAKLTKNDVLHVASLANLKLSPAEVEKYRIQLERVIGHIGALSEVDTEDVDPVSQTTGLTNVERSDEARPQDSLTQESATNTSRNTYNGYFKVEAILVERTDK